MKENQINLPPFYLGQRVVCVNDKYYDYIYCIPSTIKKGDVVIVKSTEYYLGNWEVELIEDSGYNYRAIDFAPIESTFQSITMKETIEIESPLISVN